MSHLPTLQSHTRVTGTRLLEVIRRCFTHTQRRSAPLLEVLQDQVDARSGRSKPQFHLPVPKINLIYGPRVGDVSDIKLIRTDTTLDLSQKAEKR